MYGFVVDYFFLLKYRFYKMYIEKYIFVYDKKKSRWMLLFEIGYKYFGYQLNIWNWIEKDLRI